MTRSLSRADFLWFLVASALLLLPSLCQPLIPAGDLPSHLYNAWLAVLIRHGRAPGLWIAPQWTNVVDQDVMSWLLGLVSPTIAEHIVVAVSVLIFFWGAFSFVRSVCGRVQWFIAPCLGILAYGWAFQMGFSNYYLSTGLSFFALAILWRSTARNLLLAVPLIVVASLAHPLPVIWLIGVLVYVYLARRHGPRFQLGLLLSCLMAIVLLRFFLITHFRTEWSWHQLLFITGADQAWLFGTEYALVAFPLLCLWGSIFASHVLRDARILQALPLQLFLLTGAAILLLPSLIYLPMYSAPASSLAERASLFSGVLICALVGMSKRPRRWHTVAFILLAALFFGFRYADGRAIGTLEDKVQNVINSLPPKQRILVLPPIPKSYAASPIERTFDTFVVQLPVAWRFSSSIEHSRLEIDHIADGLCVRRCFVYGNYQPSAGQFPVRARPGNHIVEWTRKDVLESYRGQYVVRPHDVPLYQIFPCKGNICLRSLHAGDENGDYTSAPVHSSSPAKISAP